MLLKSPIKNFGPEYRFIYRQTSTADLHTGACGMKWSNPIEPGVEVFTAEDATFHFRVSVYKGQGTSAPAVSDTRPVRCCINEGGLTGAAYILYIAQDRRQ